MALYHAIKEISNYYGFLYVKKEGEKYYWGIENYSGVYDLEIPKYLYFSILSYYEKTMKEDPELDWETWEGEYEDHENLSL